MSTHVTEAPSAAPEPSKSSGGRIQGGLLDPKQLITSLPDAVKKLDPRTMWRNPVMFIVEIGAVWSTTLAVARSSWFAWLIVIWLWLTVIFANLAEAVAEGRGKAQADALRRAKTDTMARRLKDWRPGAKAAEEPVAGAAAPAGRLRHRRGR